MPDIVITITDLEQKVFDSYSINPQEWSQHALSNKARKLSNRVILKETAYNTSKLDETQKTDILTQLDNEGKLTVGSMREDEIIDINTKG